MISVSDIHKIESRRNRLLKETYKHILELFDKRIRHAVSQNQKFVRLEVPSFVWGFPLYDHEKATLYLIRQLQILGYTVQRTGYTLELTWTKGQTEDTEDAQFPDEPDHDLPSLINLRKTASKIINKHVTWNL